MKGLIAIFYFMACGYLFAKYEGDKLLAEAARRAFRALVAEAAQISRDIAGPPVQVINLTSSNPARVTDFLHGAEWWEAYSDQRD